MNNSERQQKFISLAQVFRPSGPVDKGDLFQGRTGQIVQMAQTIVTPGRHGVIYGERGVGKTSLSAVSSELFKVRTIRVNCDEGDNYASIWTKVADEITEQARVRGHDEEVELVAEAEAQLTSDDISPESVRQFLRTLSPSLELLIFVDEYDQVCDPGTGPLMANTIKTLSDHLVPVTVCFIGVADNVEDLISGHLSIERNLEQVSMPRMTLDEINLIIERGYESVGLTVTSEAKRHLKELPQGLPHFAHLLAQKAGEAAVLGGTTEVDMTHVRSAVRSAISSSEASLTQAYMNAITSPHRNALYGNVLMACALAKIDDLGYFTPGDLRVPLGKIMDQNVEIDRFSRHLIKFCNERGPILERTGGANNWRYRFRNPRMRPYIIMRAIDEGFEKVFLASDDDSI
jgi:Cdc6-like AAA superfamily ATPase